MNCSESQQLLQDRLDGLPISSAGLPEHLAVCADCRIMHAGAGRLLEGLRQLKSPAPPTDLAEIIAAEVLADRTDRLTFRGRLVAVSAVAAALLLAVAAWSWLTPGEPAVVIEPPTMPKVVAVVPEPAKPSLRGSISEAGSAIVSLTWRAADDTVGPGRLLLPETVAAPLAVPEEVPTLDTPNLWSSAGMSAGIEPITNSARRAFSMLLRETPDEKR